MSTVIQQIYPARSTTSDWERHYGEIVTAYEDESRLVTVSLQPHPRPCFTPGLLKDLRAFQRTAATAIENEIRHNGRPSVDYVAFVAPVAPGPNIFNVGGDLEFFLNTIRNGDRKALEAYAYLSIDVLYSTLTNFGQPITTLAVLDGTTLGAAFEAALSTDIIIAEKGIQIGFPEVLFNMFPGMGAYSFLSRRLSPAAVERMIMSGRMYQAEELYEMGVIDILAEQGCAHYELQSFIQKDERKSITRKALLKMRERVNPITHEELKDIAGLWIESALSLPERDLRMMDRLMKAQDRRMKATPQAGGGTRRETANRV